MTAMRADKRSTRSGGTRDRWYGSPGSDALLRYIRACARDTSSRRLTLTPTLARTKNISCS